MIGNNDLGFHIDVDMRAYYSLSTSISLFAILNHLYIGAVIIDVIINC